jgi:hypothetical protein
MNVAVETPRPPTRTRLLSSELMAAVAEVEARFDVGAWRVGTLPVWPLLRARWCCAEFERQYGAAGAGAPDATGVLRRMLAGRRERTAARHADRARNDTGSARRDLVFRSDGLSFARIGAHWVERFCDPLLAAATRRGLTSALWTPLHHYHQPRATPSAWIQNGIDRANLAGYAMSRIAPVAARLPQVSELAAWLERQGLDGGRFEAPRIVSEAMRLTAISAVHRRRLRATAPSLAFLVGFYSLEGMAFVLACRESGIPVVDLQHGVQGLLHPCYAAWPHPGRGQRHPLLPDVFWTWSHEEAQAIERWSAGSGHGAFVGGNPWLDLWRAGSAWPGVAQARQTARELRAQAQGRPVVLVTLQYGLAPEEQLLPLAALLRLAGGRLAVWVRLHPAMLERRTEVRALLDAAGGAELDAPSDLPLHAVLPESDVHLTHSSTTVVEAAQAGRHSVLTSPYGQELFASLVDARRACIETGDAQAVLDALLRGAAARVGAAVDPEPADLGDALGALLARLNGARPAP